MILFDLKSVKMYSTCNKVHRNLISRKVLTLNDSRLIFSIFRCYDEFHSSGLGIGDYDFCVKTLLSTSSVVEKPEKLHKASSWFLVNFTYVYTSVNNICEYTYVINLKFWNSNSIAKAYLRKVEGSMLFVIAGIFIF